MQVLGYFAAILIGLSLGMVGSGGSILTVPVLVYLMGVNPLLATTSSLFIVGCTSLIGGLRAYSKKLIHFKAITEFGMPSIFSIFITRHYILPAIPHELFRIGNTIVTKEIMLMVVFALLMLGASYSIMRNHNDTGSKEVEKERNSRALSMVLLGLGIGVVTGLLGAGGGFLIIPSLVLFLKLPMKTAVGTSLLLVAVNSLFGFLFSLNQFEYNWTLLLTFTVLSGIGIFIGSRLAEKIPGNKLKKGFGWFVLVMAVFILVKEIFLKGTTMS
jgi:uncharacterized membrane protein YfcA